MKALVTGVDGFVGHYLVEHLLSKDIEVCGTTIQKEYINSKINVREMNLLNEIHVETVIKEVQPDMIFHLAGQSSVALSWQKPSVTMNVNVNGTIHLLEAVRNNCKKAKVLIIGSSDEYGVIRVEECPINEEQVLRPTNPYGISKMAQEEIGKLYANVHGLDIRMVRAFNHIGPGQEVNFVVSDFASRIARIERGEEKRIYVGDLSAYRDFTDVRDIVKGYELIMTRGKRGEIYNIGSGNSIQIQEVLNLLLELSDEKIEVVIDPQKLRPAEIPKVQCDNSKLKQHTGWILENDIEQTLKDVLEYWRKRID